MYPFKEQGELGYLCIHKQVPRLMVHVHLCGCTLLGACVTGVIVKVTVRAVQGWMG